MQDSKIVYKKIIVEAYYNKEYKLEILSTEDMKPSVNVVVFYSKPGQIIHDELTINFVERAESFVRAFSMFLQSEVNILQFFLVGLAYISRGPSTKRKLFDKC